MLGLTLIFGGFKIAFKKTIRIASFSALDSLNVSIDISGLKDKESHEKVKTRTRKNTSKLNQYLFDKSILEASTGSDLVFWSEGSGVILKEDAAKFYKKASEIASQYEFYLGVAIAVINPSNIKYLENKFVLFDKNGNMVIDYWKGIFVPDVEAPISKNKKTGMQKTETEYGTIAGTICFDTDFPTYIKQTKGADILLSSSRDWKEIDPIHTDMTRFRVLEQAFNFTRQTSNGLSITTDYKGNVVSEMNHFTSNHGVMISQLPTKGIITIYTIIGDSFVLICGLLLISTIIILKRIKRTITKILEKEQARIESYV